MMRLADQARATTCAVGVAVLVLGANTLTEKTEATVSLPASRAAADPPITATVAGDLLRGVQWLGEDGEPEPADLMSLVRRGIHIAMQAQATLADGSCKVAGFVSSDGIEIIFDRKDKLRRLSMKVSAGGALEAVRVDAGLRVGRAAVTTDAELGKQLAWVGSEVAA